MKPTPIRVFLVLVVPVLWFAGGCATAPDTRPQTLSKAASAAWSLKHDQKMVVAVSPAGKTLRIGGVTGTIVGAGIDAAVNDRYREKLDKALGDYDPVTVFTGLIKDRLVKAVPTKLKQVPPLMSYTQFRNEREAQKARYKALYKRGEHQVLDLEALCGLYGPDALPVAKIKGELHLLPDGKEVWDNDIVVATDPILAAAPLRDPSRSGFLPNLANPRFKADADAISQWTEDGGAKLKRDFDGVFNGAISALLCDLGLAEDPLGEYYLGKLALLRKHFDEAKAHFDKAIQLDPNLLEARNGQAVNAGHAGNVKEAAALEEKLVADHPDYGPAWLNLAWWYATDLKNPAKAKADYQKALALGMPAMERIEKAIKKAS